MLPPLCLPLIRAMKHRFKFWANIVQLLLAVAVLRIAAGECLVNHIGSLGACLRSDSTEVVIQRDYAVGQALGQDAAAPLQLRRNLTIRGPAGRQPDAWPVLDLGFLAGAVEICGHCIVTLRDLVLKNERKGSGVVFDLFVGQPGSRLRTINTYKLRQACTPPGSQATALDTYRRSPLFPNSMAPQKVLVSNVTYKGKVYVDSVVAVDTTHDVPLGVVEGPRDSKEGGYAQFSQNCVRLCEAYVSNDCLATKSADACITQMADSSTTIASAPPGLAPAAAAAILVPLCVGFLGAAALTAWWARRRCSRPPPGPGSGGSKHHSTGSRGARSAPGRSASGCTGRTSETESSSTVGSCAGPCLGKPLAAGTGWELVDSKTSPLLGPVEDNTIELGTLLGSGSFGKVFKGRWNNMDVAVKVIEHSGSAAAAVQHEVEMMMAFHHPHIVRALHCITYVHKDSPDSEYSVCTSLSRHNSGVTVTGASFTQLRPLHTCRTAGSFSCLRPVSTATLQGTTAAPGAPAAASTTPNSMGANLGVAAPEAAAPGVTALLAGCQGRCRSSPCCHLGGDTVLTITEGVACSDQQLLGCQCGCCCAPAAAAATVHVEARSCSKVAQPCSTLPSLHRSLSGIESSTAGDGSSGGSRHVGTSCSLGSSVDCKCLTDQQRSSKTFKEPERRLETWLVLEFCNCGSLTNYLSNWPAPSCSSSMLQLLQLLQDAAMGLQELHKEQVVHGDLNGRNVLVMGDEGGVHAKLSDLGLSRSVHEHQRHRTTNTVGTMSHVAPEMLRSGHMSAAADIYALGIMMWELYTGEDAFQRLQHPGQFFETVVLQDLRPVIPQGVPADYQMLMQHCWATEPDARPNIGRVLECLQYMIRERQQQTAGATHTSAGAASRVVVSAPLPALLENPPPPKQHWWQHQHLQRLSLLKVPGSDDGNSQLCSGSPSQASSRMLPSFVLPGSTTSPTHSNSLLPVLLDDEEPAGTSQAQPGGTDSHTHFQPPAQQQDPQAQRDQQPPGHAPAACVSQPLPSTFAGSSFSFYKRLRPFKQAAEEQSREDSCSHMSSSSGKLPTLFQGLTQGSFSLREMSFSFSSSRGTSWSGARPGSQTGEHAWFV